MGKDAISSTGAGSGNAPDAAVGATRVFLSYSRKDAPRMQRLADALITHPDFEPDFDRAEHDPHNVNSGVTST